jgi:hypothetical protein
MAVREQVSFTLVQVVRYFPAHKTQRDFFFRNFRKNNDECILILVIYWKKTGLLHTKISNHNIIYCNKTVLLHTKITNHNIIYSS